MERLPYFPEQAIEMLSAFDAIVVAGARKPVAFFGYPNLPSELIPDRVKSEVLADPLEDVPAALESLAAEIGAGSDPARRSTPRPERPQGALDPASLGRALAAVLPENAIVMDEAATSGMPFFAAAAGVPHTYLALTGGAIGQGLPCSTGAAIACPGRRVIAFQADGSGMYTVQSLWTMARESLDVTIVVCANRRYRILQLELARAGVTKPGATAQGLTDLHPPVLDWVALAKGMGVPGARAETADELVRSLERSLAESGPSLIEVVL